MLPVQALPLAGSTQVIVRADTALVAGPYHRPIATVTDHIGVHQAAGHLLSTRGAVVPPTLLLLCRKGREPEGGTPQFPLIPTGGAGGLSVSGPLALLSRHGVRVQPGCSSDSSRGTQEPAMRLPVLCLVPSTGGPGKQEAAGSAAPPLK